MSARRPSAAPPIVALLIAALAIGAAHAQGTPAPAPTVAPGAVRTSGPPIQAHAEITPSVAELGQQVRYQAWVLRPGARTMARWLPPDTSEALTWGPPTVLQRDWIRRKAIDGTVPHDIHDTLFVEIPLQAFALGHQDVPGVPVEIDDGRGPRVVHLPVVGLDIVPVLTAADSNADYRNLHAPLAAPWWERVPWAWIGVALAVIAVAVVLWRSRRRRAQPVAAEATGPLDAREEALAALAALRALDLPEHGRFPEHAFRLGQILRRYLEATTGVARPGDSTPELVAHLKGARLDADDLGRLSALLRVWDRIKFARDPFTLDEAVRAERAVESFVRRPLPAAPAAPAPAAAEKVA